MDDTTKVQVPVTFEAQDVIPISVKADKMKSRLEEAKMLSKLGASIVRVKNKSMAVIGKHMEELGIKQIGHGRIAIAGDNAEVAVAKIGAYVDHLMAQPNVSPEVIAIWMELQKDFNRQIMDSGEMHIKASAVAESDGNNKSISLPFPAGSQVAVAIGPPIVEQVKQIESSEKPS